MTSVQKNPKIVHGRPAGEREVGAVAGESQALNTSAVWVRLERDLLIALELALFIHQLSFQNGSVAAFLASSAFPSCSGAGASAREFCLAGS